MKEEKWSDNLFLFSCTNPLCVRSVWAEWTAEGWKRVTLEEPSKKAKKVVGSHFAGDSILYFDGGKERKITSKQLEQIKSSVMTHEGEHLLGKAAQKYMDTHSKKYLGKDLAGSYKNQEIQGYAK